MPQTINFFKVASINVLYIIFTEFFWLVTSIITFYFQIGLYIK